MMGDSQIMAVGIVTCQLTDQSWRIIGSANERIAIIQ